MGRRAVAFAQIYVEARRVLVNGIGGMPTFLAASQLMSIRGFKVIGDTIVEIFVVADPTRVVAYDCQKEATWLTLALLPEGILRVLRPARTRVLA